MKRLWHILRLWWKGLLAGCIVVGAMGAEVEVRLRVIDGTTKVPVAAEIFLRKGEGEFDNLGVATNGTFDFAPLAFSKKIRVRAQAEDYSLGWKWIELTNSRIVSLIELERTVPFRGVVVAPTGQAIRGAKVITIARRKFLGIEPGGKIQNFENLPLDHTDTDGRFTVGLADSAEALLAVHDLGLSLVSLVGWTNETHLVLRPWAAAKGRMLINNVPAANEGLLVSSLRMPGAQWSLSLSKYEAQTDANGNFFFDGLPAGEIMLMWKVPTGGRGSIFSHGTSFVIDPATQSNLRYHLRGRTVRGHFAPDGKFDWNAMHVIGYVIPKPQPLSEFNPIGVSGGHIALRIDNNGTFEAAAVPPGTYQIHVFAHRQNGISQRIERELLVPNGSEPLDLGEVAVKVTK